MNAVRESINTENWEETIKNCGFSFPEVERYINESYNNGYRARDEQTKSSLKSLFRTNLLKTNQITEDLLSHLGTLNVQPISAYLKIESGTSFSMIITVNLEDYISDKILKAYGWISDIEMEVNNKNYSIDLSFMHGDENVNIESLNADGYRFKHKKLQ